MKAIIEILTDDLGKDYMARWVDGRHISGKYGDPERAIQSLLEHLGRIKLEDEVRETRANEARQILDSGACSGCYAEDDTDTLGGADYRQQYEVAVREAAAGHPAAAIGDDGDWYEGTGV